MSETTGQQLFDIVNSTTVTPYPAFTGDQGDMYANLIQQFNQNKPDILPTIQDFRTDVYPNTSVWAPSSVNSLILKSVLPAGLTPQ